MPGESVEQAALRRAAENADDLPAPFGSIFAAVDAVARLNDTRYRDLSDRYHYVCETSAALEVQVSEQADAILALSNRIESLTSAVKHVVPEWPCLCGARNRLRDLVCRNCGAPKP